MTKTILRCSLIRVKFLKRRIAYSHHQTASFNPSIHIVSLSGDVHPQPGPTTKSNDGTITSTNPTKRASAAPKCKECAKTVRVTQKSFKCTKCLEVTHIYCYSQNTQYIQTLPSRARLDGLQ